MITQEQISEAADEQYPIDRDYFNRGGAVDGFKRGAQWMQDQTAPLKLQNEKLMGLLEKQFKLGYPLNYADVAEANWQSFCKEHGLNS